jgi:hypothetical protein
MLYENTEERPRSGNGTRPAMVTAFLRLTAVHKGWKAGNTASIPCERAATRGW